MSFFAFEGIDGSGKSTQIEMLEQKLLKQGFDVLRIREPGGTLLSEEIREIILKPREGGLNAKAELFLYSASRAQLLQNVVAPAVRAGKVVLSDRSPWSTLAYQGYGRNLPLDEIQTLLNMTCEDLWPKQTFVIDISVAESRVRLESGRQELDRIEQEEDAFFEKVRKGYQIISEKHKSVVLLDGADSIDQIHEQILSYVVSNLKESK